MGESIRGILKIQRRFYMGKIVLGLAVLILAGFEKLTRGDTLDGVQFIFAGVFGLSAVLGNRAPMIDKTLMDGLGFIFFLLGLLFGPVFGFVTWSAPLYTAAAILLFRPPKNTREKYWLLSGLAFAIALLIALTVANPSSPGDITSM